MQVQIGRIPPKWRTTCAALAALALLLGTIDAYADRNPLPATPVLRDAAPSMDALIARFLGALAGNNTQALRRLRVTEREYIDVVMPGSREPGKERRTFPEEKAKYFWDVLNEKSAYGEISLLNNFGGRRYKIRDVSWAKGVKQFDGYTGYAQLRLKVEDEKGDSHEINTGSVAEIGGRYKFVSYIRD